MIVTKAMVDAAIKEHRLAAAECCAIEEGVRRMLQAAQDAYWKEVVDDATGKQTDYAENYKPHLFSIR